VASKAFPKILIVTPEVTYLPDRMGSFSDCLTAKAGGLADVSASLICELFRQGADIHVAIPDYRTMFGDCLTSFLQKEQTAMRRVLPEDRLHLAEDQAFFHRRSIYSGDGEDNMKLAMAFQREVINNIIPRVEPDLIHCNDWMTGLIPALAREIGIPCLFTIHNIHSMKTSLAIIEDRGIDARYFWNHLYFDRMPGGYEESRYTNPIELLTSGVFAANFVNVVSPNFLLEIIMGHHDFVGLPLQQELRGKLDTGCAFGILNTPNSTFDPSTDADIVRCYGPQGHATAKRENKVALQKALGLRQDENAPVFFWPSRLDPVQKGCQLLADILYNVISRYWDQKLEIAFVADGAYQQVFDDITAQHGLHDRVAVCNFDERLEHLAYAAADFVLMPSKFEPCGLPQMIGLIYGALPVAHDTGGIHETVIHLDVDNDIGNGFLFVTYDSSGLFWAIDQAMQFYMMPINVKRKQIERIMRLSAETFNYKVNAKEYINLYEKMLQCPVVPSD
jgi:starch synthase/alpha-amylase